jgi:hypothetical protein
MGMERMRKGCYRKMRTTNQREKKNKKERKEKKRQPGPALRKVQLVLYLGIVLSVLYSRGNTPRCLGR